MRMRLLSARALCIAAPRPNIPSQRPPVLWPCRFQSSSIPEPQQTHDHGGEEETITRQSGDDDGGIATDGNDVTEGGREVLCDKNDRAVVRQFTTFLDRLVPGTAETDLGRDRSSSRFHPNESFLAFFPPSEGPGSVAADGGIQGHVPRGVHLARDWEEWDAPPPQQGAPGYWKRLWKGGEVAFRASVPLPKDDGTTEDRLGSWRCIERVRFPEGVVAGGHDSVASTALGTALDVAVERRYKSAKAHRSGVVDGSKPERCIVEVRRLAFVSGPVNVDPTERVIKARTTPTDTYEFCPTAADLVEFSRLTHNAHFIHLDHHPDRPSTMTRSFVQGSLLLAVMIRAAEHAALSAALRPSSSSEGRAMERDQDQDQEVVSPKRQPGPDEASSHGGDIVVGSRPRNGRVATLFIKSLSYRILRPSVGGRRLRVCVRKPPPTGRGEAGGDWDTARPTVKNTGAWPVWIEDVKTGGMVFRGSVEMRPGLALGWTGEEVEDENHQKQKQKRKGKLKERRRKRVEMRRLADSESTSDKDDLLPLHDDWERHTI